MKFAPYTFSKINTYETCPRKFKFQYIDKVSGPFVYNEALIKGNAVHSILEALPDKHNGKYYDKYKHIVDEFLQTGIGKRYFEVRHSKEQRIALNNVLEPCAYNDNNVIFRGIVDYVTIITNIIILVDWKTGFKKEFTSQSFLQLLLYAIYFFQKYKINDILLSYVYIEHNHENTLLLNRSELNNYKNTLLNIVSNIETDLTYDKNITPLCSWCDFMDIC
jgi:CRISPR/Cas system-associated exonuclease Cas4 (RecB family)